MATPTENPQAGQEKAQQAPAAGPEKTQETKSQVRIERGTHKEAKDQQQDNAEFLNALDKVTPEQQKKNLEKAAEWEKNGDLDLLRAAGLSLDQVRQNPLERHVMLASMYLRREKTAGGGLLFRVDYGNNEMSAWDLDVADILPPNILTVDILDEQNKLICAGATRGFEDSRPGYFNPRTRERIVVQHGQKISIRETQSPMAIRDKVYGEQTSLHAEREARYLTENAQKTVVKDQIREEARKQNKEVKTDKSFFDVFLSDLLGKNVNFNGLADPNNPLKIDFSKIQGALNDILGVFGFDKIVLPGATAGTAAPGATGTAQAGAAPSTAPSSASQTPAASPPPAEKPAETGRPTTRDQLGAGRESTESRNTPRINQEWLLANVGRTNAEVQRFMVKINFLGVNLRVNRLMAPYLIEAEERAKAANIKYIAKPDQTSCQNWRPIRGGTALSMHCWGTAIDLNSAENPWQPQLNKNPANKSKVVTNIPPEFVAIMADVGIRNIWWDPMHFELSANPYQNQGVLHSEKARQAASQYLA